MSAEASRFTLDDTPIYDAYIAGRMSAALAVAVRIGLFELLELQGPSSADHIGERLGFAPRPMRALLVALQGMGLLAQTDAVFTLTDCASAYLVRGKPGWLGGLIDLEVEHFLSPETLLEAMRSNHSSVYAGDDPWQAHLKDPEKARAFTAAMHSVSERPAWGLARAVDFRGIRRLLDVGGGSGVLSIALAQHWPQLRCTVLDLPAVCHVADEYIARAGCSARVDTQPGDMFAQPLPTGYDAILFSQILHDWPLETGLSLLEKAHGALEAGGLVLIHEKLVDEAHAAPLANALVNLDMMVWTQGQQYSEQALREALSKAEFVDPVRRPTAGYWSVVWARRGT